MWGTGVTTVICGTIAPEDTFSRVLLADQLLPSEGQSTTMSSDIQHFELSDRVHDPGVMMTTLLKYLTTNDWVLLTSKARRVNFGPGAVMISEGSLVNPIYIFLAGSARVEVRTQAGPSRIATLQCGAVCGEMAFLEEEGASASVIAEEAVEANAFDRAVLKCLFESFPHLASRFWRSLALVLSQRLRNNNLQLK